MKLKLVLILLLLTEVPQSNSVFPRAAAKDDLDSGAKKDCARYVSRVETAICIDGWFKGHDWIVNQ